MSALPNSKDNSYSVPSFSFQNNLSETKKNKKVNTDVNSLNGFNNNSVSYYSADSFDYIIDDEQLEVIIRGINQNIEREMSEQGLTQRALADLSGVGNSNLSHYFHYDSIMNMKTFFRITWALKISPVELLPFDSNSRKTNGNRFDELTADLPLECVNYLLDMVAGFVRTFRRITKK